MEGIIKHMVQIDLTPEHCSLLATVSQSMQFWVHKLNIEKPCRNTNANIVLDNQVLFFISPLFRNIKMSSPRINNTIIFGGLLIYLAVIFMSMDYAGILSELNRHICMVKGHIYRLIFEWFQDIMINPSYSVYVVESTCPYMIFLTANCS